MKKSEARLTVVIPVYNREELVKETLRSVAQQTLRPLDVILVDNNSTDSSLEVLHQWAVEHQASDFRVRVVEEPKAGAAAARNRGLREVETPYTMFFDSDDTMAPSHCQRALSAYEKYPQADIVGWDVDYQAVDGSQRNGKFYTHDALWHCIHHGSFATQRYAARTELFRQAGGWNEKCPGWDDIELGARLLKLKPNVVKLKGEPTVCVKAQKASISGTDYASKSAAWENALDLISQTIGEDKRRRRWVALRRAHLAGLYASEGASAKSEELLKSILLLEPCPFYRSLLHLSATYTRLGGRGLARLLRPLF